MITYRDLAADCKAGLRILLALVLVAGWFFLYCTYAEACNRAGCGLFGRQCRFQQHHAVAVQKVVTYVPPVIQNIFYQVGAELRIESIVEKKLKDDPRWQEFQQYKQFQKYEQQKQSAPPAPAEVQSVLSAKCASCHSGANPKGSLLLDGTGEITPELVTKIRNSVLSGRMPKDRPPLTDEEFSNLALELGIYVEEWFKKEE